MLHSSIFTSRVGAWRRRVAFAFVLGASIMGPAHAHSVTAWLEVKPLQGRSMVQITANALALETLGGLDFSFSLRRQNKGNTSNTKQSGRFDLAPSEPKVLSTTSINLQQGDELLIELKVLDHGREVSSANSVHAWAGRRTNAVGDFCGRSWLRVGIAGATSQFSRRMRRLQATGGPYFLPAIGGKKIWRVENISECVVGNKYIL